MLIWMSPPQGSRDYVSHATSPPDTKLRTKIQVILPGANLYLNKLAPSVGPKISSTKKADGRSGRRRSINEWADLREAFAARYSVRRACFKEPCEITKIVRKANESLSVFKERWTVETGFIMGIPEVMKISSFMDAVKSPELAKRFLNKVPTTGKWGKPIAKRPLYSIEETTGHPETPTRENHEGVSIETVTEAKEMRTSRTDRELTGPRTPPPRGEYNHRVTPVLSLESLTKRPKEILAAETQLHLPAPRPMLSPLRSGNTDRYCDYHQEKGHYINDCIQLRKQLEMALESGKLNHLVKDIRQRGNGIPWQRGSPTSK
nr:reverse transcriptase domain-containing protein [Tanacetum cinerariifolium]